MLCPCHALTMPFFSRPRHSTSIERRPVGYLPAFGFFRLPCEIPRRLLSEAYQSSSQWSIPTTVKTGSKTLQKRQSVKPLDQQFGYFQLPCRLSRRTRHCWRRAGARHGMCELTARHGRGTAWPRHAMCELAFIHYSPWGILWIVQSRQLYALFELEKLWKVTFVKGMHSAAAQNLRLQYWLKCRYLLTPCISKCVCVLFNGTVRC